MDEEVEEGKEMKDDKKAKGKKEMEERLGTTNDPMGSYEHGNLAEEDELEEEMDLEELLAELSKEKMDEEDTYEGLYEEEDEMGMEMGDEEMGEPTDEEMEAMIQDVIADMIENGELVAGPNFDGEGEMGGEEMGDEELDLDELLSGYSKTPKKSKDSDSKGYFEPEETNSEVPKKFKDTSGKGYFELDEEDLDEVDLDELLAEIKKEMAKETMSKKSKEVSEEYMNEAKVITKKEAREYAKSWEDDDVLSNFDATFNNQEKITRSEFMKFFEDHIDDMSDMNYVQGAWKKLSSGEGLYEKKKMKKDLEEAYDTIKTLRSEMNEVNLLNAKLLYTNKVFRAKNLTESQKVKVLETFDKATTVKEVKLVFESLSFDTKPSKVVKNSLRESLGGASKALGTSAPKKPILEINEQFSRMQRLAGIIK